jgi:hypothetical protein
MVALLYYIPDRRGKGSPPLPSENQEEREEGSHICTGELISGHTLAALTPQLMCRPTVSTGSSALSCGQGTRMRTYAHVCARMRTYVGKNGDIHMALVPSPNEHCSAGDRLPGQLLAARRRQRSDETRIAAVAHI